MGYAMPLSNMMIYKGSPDHRVELTKGNLYQLDRLTLHEDRMHPVMAPERRISVSITEAHAF